MMTRYFTITMLAYLTACSSNSDAVTTLAIRLANEGGAGVSKERREDYVTCGVKTLSNVPSKRIDAALEASDVPAIWEILGSDTLDAYVKTCRQTELRRSPPPQA
ncbi:hypothetical protein [Sphingopyxis sp. LC81]|uniref:hypothetical protein n=1 Tax=Sphingopyxis sp. LC81 TaxID=1502850 RepID=UPI001269F047|nr:hypothetical protein [Sphingopyxis sp. LC81]